MRIGLLHYTYAPVIGGVERVVDDLHTVLQINGHEVQLLSGDHPLLDADRPIPSTPSLDVLLVHNVMTMPFNMGLRSRLIALARDAGFCRQTRLVNWVHDVASVSPAYNSLPQAVRAELDHFGGTWTHVAVSGPVAETFRRATGLTAQVIPNGINPARTLDLSPRIAQLAEQHNWWADSLVLLLPARFVPRKRIEDAISLVEQLQRNSITVDLLLTGARDPHIGNGSPAASYEQEILARMASSPAAQRIRTLSTQGPLSARDMSSLYHLCDAVILPSETEGFGLPALEAAIHRKPFICNFISPLRDLPGTTPLDMRTPPFRSVVDIITGLAQDSALKARKSVLSEHRWQSIYVRAIAPLLVAAR